MLKFILKLILGTLLLVIGINIESSLSTEFIGGGIILISATILVDGADFIFTNWGRLIFIIHTKYLAIHKEYIRFSMSYQYQIKVNDKFLLVKNSNPNWHWYQHVGGKYKRIEETQSVLKKIEAKDDLKMKTTELKKGDLAVFVPAKNAVKFISWFNTEKDREISHWREFYEELLGGKEKKILSRKNFGYVNYKFLGSVRTPVKKTPIDSGWDCWEVLQYDVLELIPTLKQQQELEELYQKGDTEYIKWASASLIDRLGHDVDDHQSKYKIGPHAKWVLHLKWSKQ